MKFITELHNKHEHRPIWIAGSGPSLDSYPSDFLRDKAAIALHLAYLKYPDTTYRHANEYDRVKWFREHRPEYLEKKNIFAFPFYNRTERNVSSIIDIDNPNYYFLILRPLPEKEIEYVCRKVREARGKQAIDFGGYGTCVHAAMYAAIVMGGNPINLIGCNHESKDGLEHFKMANDNNWYRTKSTPYAVKGQLMKEGTELIIEACEREGIKVNWIKSYDDWLENYA